MEQKIYQATSNILAFKKIKFGHVIYLSKYYEAIENIEGVTYVTILADDFSREGKRTLEDNKGKIQLRPSELPRIPGTDVNDSSEDAAFIGGIHIVELEGGY